MENAEVLKPKYGNRSMEIRQDHFVMLNDWSPMCQYSALTLLGNSHPLATVRHYTPTAFLLTSILQFQHFKYFPLALCLVSLWYMLLPYAFADFWALCAHTQCKYFYNPFYHDFTHVRKDTRQALFHFSTLQATEC